MTNVSRNIIFLPLLHIEVCNMNKSIELPCGSVVGIGKLKVFASDSFSHEIPTLSFTVSKDESGYFTATCIQLVLEGDGGTPDSAISNMQNTVVSFLTKLFSTEKTKGSAWEQLHELYNDSISREYWNAYRDMQLNLAEQGISTDTKQMYINEIIKLKERIAELEGIIASDLVKPFTAKIVAYQETAA